MDERFVQLTISPVVINDAGGSFATYETLYGLTNEGRVFALYNPLATYNPDGWKEIELSDFRS